jgi:catechol 2,3-dioxygenase-like lactoylglutathione lyase family enzyme
MTKLHVGILCAMVGDQDEALAWYTEKLGFELRGDTTFGDWRWVTVGAPGQPDFEISLIDPDVRPDMAADIRSMMARGGLNGIIIQTDDCRAAYQELKARGVEFTSEPEDVFYGVDCGFRDPFGNGFRLTQVAPVPAAPTPETMPSA